MRIWSCSEVDFRGISGIETKLSTYKVISQTIFLAHEDDFSKGNIVDIHGIHGHFRS